MNKLLNNLLAFSGGIFGASFLFIIFFFIKNPFPPTPLGHFLTYLILAGFIEEGVKFLLIKRNIGQYPYGLTLGLGFGIGETILKYPLWDYGFVPVNRSGAIVLHIITAGIIAYFVKKNKPLLGLIIAIIIHTGYNLIVMGL